MEGCRDGSKNWGEELASTLLECGFVRAQSLPSLFYNKKWQCWIAAYSDDLFCVGAREHLRKVRKHLQDKYDLTGDVVGPYADEGEVLQGEILHRLVRWTPTGYEWEADPKHVKKHNIYVQKRKFETVYYTRNQGNKS